MNINTIINNTTDVAFLNATRDAIWYATRNAIYFLTIKATSDATNSAINNFLSEI